jgi:hypothetical protein
MKEFFIIIHFIKLSKTIKFIMPFHSRAQMYNCYDEQFKKKGKDRRECNKFLSETDDLTCLPNRSNKSTRSKSNSRSRSRSKSRERRNGEKTCYVVPRTQRKPSKVFEGPNGGIYFYAGPKKYNIKIYIKHENRKEAIKQLGYGGIEERKPRRS